MSQLYLGLRISKYAPPESGTEPGDLNYIPRNDRPERTTRVAFLLQDVITWEECTQEFYQYFDKRAKLVIELREGAGDIIIIEDFDRFTGLMENFRESSFITLRNQ